MLAGISSQYGFLYQRYAFIKIVLDNAGMTRFFTYEGIDDIDISETDGIMSVRPSYQSFIQVKSGTVSKACWAKVIGNWLLANDGDAQYTVVLENGLPFDTGSKDTLKSIYEYFNDGRTKKATSIANKVYKRFLEGAADPENHFNLIVLELLKHISCDVIPLEELKDKIETTFRNIYCQDIVEFDMAKTRRCERFIRYIYEEIDASIEKKKSYVIMYPHFISIINTVTAEISDKKYNISTLEMRKRKTPEAEKLLSDNTLREVRQLRKVNCDNRFIVQELVRELLYKDFRSVYSEKGSSLISNMEDIAHTNYEDVRFSLPDNPGAKQVFDKTVDREIPSSIIENSPIYRHGCYIYLTGQDIDPEQQITWEYEHE